jgi:tRNA (uracil-5-)-methyltransferase TRM9
MRREVNQKLTDLNLKFYRDFGRAFSATRQRVQPGVKGLLERLPAEGRWLDLGCGNGELGRELQRRGFRGEYWGVDASAEMMGADADQPPIVWFASEGKPRFAARRIIANLADLDWVKALPAGKFNIITAFAALHHLPGAALRVRFLRQVKELLSPGGSFIHSEWQFQHSPKLMARRIAWEEAGLAESDVEAGDTLLDWRYNLPGQAEERGLRYVHLFSREELEELAQESGFKVMETFESDGKGGRLGLYQVWKLASDSS